ncbi:hypothetical protein [Streptomyces lusitanus]|uniref:hypothetical protein n=1 Tax=Streptomyces lusitanus TaxID=68232 RepID=UPI0021C1133B|nr:hypothetical protein [Streptomyces lusitanus]
MGAGHVWTVPVLEFTPELRPWAQRRRGCPRPRILEGTRWELKSVEKSAVHYLATLRLRD